MGQIRRGALSERTAAACIGLAPRVFELRPYALQIPNAMTQRYGFGGGRMLPVGAPIPL